MHIPPQPFFLSPESAGSLVAAPPQRSEAPAYGHLPDVPVDVFSRHPRAAYLVAVTAVGSDVLMPEAYEASRVLRYNKYAELGWVDSAKFDIARNGSRMEPLDDHDASSYHLSVIKNMRGQRPNKLIATGRSIIKGSGLLPVEYVFPEIFAEKPAPTGANEVSRLISDSLHKPERALASMALQRGMTNLAVQEDHGPTYAMTEKYLVNRLEATHFPHDMMTDFKPIKEYKDTLNALMMTDWRKVTAGTALFRSGVPLKTGLFFRGVEKPGIGLGYYGRRFLYRYGPAKSIR